MKSEKKNEDKYHCIIKVNEDLILIAILVFSTFVFS